MKNQFYFGAAAIAMAVVAAAPAYAQETTSAIRGTVLSSGQPVGGAAVTVTHEPSGTTVTLTTEADGSFSANGLRVGGPFTVKVAASGYEDSSVTDIFLSAGQPLRLPIDIQQASEIVVTAARANALEVSTGPITALGREDIDGVASINRDIRDLARRNPFATIDLSNSRTIEIAGNNGRLNRFSVDGVQFSDDFGLNNGGLPTSRGPVPFDAIEQFAVKVAPYEISEGDFSGGAINVVLRSGTNKWFGTGFYTYTSDGLTGTKVRGTPVSLDFSSKQYGATLAGPIIKDKLFFMASYEKTKESDPFDNGLGAGFANQIPNLTEAQVANISTIAKNSYNYDTLGLVSNATEQDEKFIGKLDWNINNDHRAALTYIRNIGNQQFQQNTSISVTTPALGLFSDYYELTEEVNSGVFQLNSNWSDTFSTEVRASYRDYNRGQTPFGSRDIGQVQVCMAPTSAGAVNSCPTGTPSVTFGPDSFRHSNALNQENLSVDFTARLEMGDHSLKFTAGYTDIKTFNLFVPRSLGQYYYDSVADFAAGNAGQLTYANAVPSLNPADGAANFKSRTFTFGLQDDWQINDKLQLTYGARYDLFDNPEAPPLNPNFLARLGYSNRATFNGRGVFQPRMGLNYEATDRLILRAGAGIFSGGTPEVFLSNSFSNTGQLTNQVVINRDGTCATAGSLCDLALNGFGIGTIKAGVNDFLTSNVASLANAPVNAIDPNLKIARQLKASLSADYEADLGALGDGWLFGAELLYSKNIYGYNWFDGRSVPIGTLPDGRLRYGVLPGATGTNQDLIMTNSTQGRSILGAVRFAKSWDFGLSIDGSYTRADIKDVNALTSSTAGSLYNNNVFSDPNTVAYGRSIYEIKDQWKFNVDFKREFFGDNETRISIFGEYRTGRPYSLTMLDTTGTSSSNRSVVFGTVGTGGRQLLYVPLANDPLVVFDSAASLAAFDAQVAALGLEKFRGKLVSKNSQNSPDFFKVDMKVSQQIPGFFGSSKFTVFADLENVLNLIDSDWGALRQVSFPYAHSLVRSACATTVGNNCTQYRYSSVTSPNLNLSSRQSLWGIRVGAKFTF